MSDKERDPNEQALRHHADMIEVSCKETPQLRRRIERLREAADHIAELTERLAKAEAVVEKLPRTADGVRVVPGMKLYRYEKSLVGKWYSMHQEDICLAGYSGDYYDPHPIEGDRLYSTDEAALAARSEGGE